MIGRAQFSIVLVIYLLCGQISVQTTAQQTNSPSHAATTRVSIQNEGLACFAIATAIPGLKTLTGKSGTCQNEVTIP